MALTTFQGPVRSLGGFISQGPNAVANLANGTNTITLDPTYAGKVVSTSDATLVITLPSINASADPVSSGPGADPNTPNNLGIEYYLYIDTTASALSIQTDGTDKFVGSVLMVDTDSSGATYGYAPAASNDVINLNGTTTGGIAGSWVKIVAIAANKYFVQGVLLGSGSVATPFADS